MAAEEKWSYIDATGATQGPVAELELKRLIRDGTVPVATLVWSHDLVPCEWTKLADVPELGAAAQEEKSWFFLAGSEQNGPFSVPELTEKFAGGEIDGLTMLWSDLTPTETWKPLGEIPTLRERLTAETTPAPAPAAAETADASGEKGPAAETANASGKKRPLDSPAENETQPKKRKRKRRKKKKKVKNTWAYVTGLDIDIDSETLAGMFSKFGIIEDDVVTMGPKVKIYCGDNGKPKGDASICFLKQASVALAMQMLDGVEYKPGFKLSVGLAQWDKKQASKGSSTKPKKPAWSETLTAAEYKKRLSALRRKQAAKLGWKSEGIQNIVVLKNVFSLDSVRKDAKFAAELRADMRAGASPFGEVTLVTVSEHNEDGVVLLKFKLASSAGPCVDKMNGRFFGGRKLSAELWDGYSNYIVEESEKSKAKRKKEFGDWLEDGDDDDEDGDDTEAQSTAEAKSEPPATAEREANPLEAYTDRLMGILMGEDDKLTQENRATITQKLDGALDWMQDNRGSMGNTKLLQQKKLQLEAVVGPLLKELASFGDGEVVGLEEVTPSQP